jgi:hypothetical protein
VKEKACEVGILGFQVQFIILTPILKQGGTVARPFLQ